MLQLNGPGWSKHNRQWSRVLLIFLVRVSFKNHKSLVPLSFSSTLHPFPTNVKAVNGRANITHLYCWVFSMSQLQWEAYISPPPPKSKLGPGPGNPDVLAKTKTFVFWHIAEISGRYCRQIDRTDVAHLFCFQEIMKNWPRGPKKRPMTPKKFCLGVQKRGPWLGICPPRDLGQKTRFSNGMAHKRSNVSVKKSQIGFFHTNFSRSRLSFMLNNYEDG